MRSIVARGVNFGMAVAYMISAEQRAIETVASIDIYPTRIFAKCLRGYVLQTDLLVPQDHLRLTDSRGSLGSPPERRTTSERRMRLDSGNRLLGYMSLVLMSYSKPRAYTNRYLLIPPWSEIHSCLSGSERRNSIAQFRMQPLCQFKSSTTLCVHAQFRGCLGTWALCSCPIVNLERTPTGIFWYHHGVRSIAVSGLAFTQRTDCIDICGWSMLKVAWGFQGFSRYEPFSSTLITNTQKCWQKNLFKTITNLYISGEKIKKIIRKRTTLTQNIHKSSLTKNNRWRVTLGNSTLITDTINVKTFITTSKN